MKQSSQAASSVLAASSSNLDCLSQGLPPSFQVRFQARLQQLVRGQVDQVSRLQSFRLERVRIVSRRLDRYIDSSLSAQIQALLLPLMSALSPVEFPEGFIGLSRELGDPCDNTLYVFCDHVLIKDEEEWLAGIRATTNSLLIAWCWDNHHHPQSHVALASLVDICIPAHHHGAAILKAANPATSDPLPLCCAQWSSSTLNQLRDTVGDFAASSDLIFARFTDWASADHGFGAGTRRRDLARFYAEDCLGGDVDLRLESAETFDYFSLSAEERFHDWRRHRLSLCVPLRKDLSLRFFDALACGLFPIVDADIHPAALQDLAPSLRPGIDYLVVDASSPAELRAARDQALLLHTPEQSRRAAEVVLQHHLLEHRLALLIGAVLAGCEQRQMPQANVRPSGLPQAEASLLAQALDALRPGQPDAPPQQLRPLHRLLQARSQPMDPALPVAASLRLARALADAERSASGAEAVPPSPQRLACQALAQELAGRLQRLSCSGQWRGWAVPPSTNAPLPRSLLIERLLALAAVHDPWPDWISSAVAASLKVQLAELRHQPLRRAEQLAVVLRWRETVATQPALAAELSAGFAAVPWLPGDAVLVSVVLPDPGDPAALSCALAALAGQSLRRLELIVVTNGGDGLVDAFAPLQRQDALIRLIRPVPAGGLHQARLQAAAQACGRYLWFPDPSGPVEPRFLAEMVAMALTTGAEIVECPMVDLDGSPGAPGLAGMSGAAVRHGGGILSAYLQGRLANPLANKLIERRLWLQLAPSLVALAPTALPFAHDIATTMQLLGRACLHATTVGTASGHRPEPLDAGGPDQPDRLAEALRSLELLLQGLAPQLERLAPAELRQAFVQREGLGRMEALLQQAHHGLDAEAWARVARIRDLAQALA